MGLGGVYVKHGLDVQEAALRDGARPGGAGWGAEPEAAWGRLWDGSGPRAVPTEPGDYPAFYAGDDRARCATARRRRWPRTTPSPVLEVIEAARRSAAESGTS